MKACPASLFLEDFSTTMVSTHRSLPSFGITNLMFFSVVGHQPSHASAITISPLLSMSPKVTSSYLSSFGFASSSFALTLASSSSLLVLTE